MTPEYLSAPIEQIRGGPLFLPIAYSPSFSSNPLPSPRTPPKDFKPLQAVFPLNPFKSACSRQAEALALLQCPRGPNEIMQRGRAWRLPLTSNDTTCSYVTPTGELVDGAKLCNYRKGLVQEQTRTTARVLAFKEFMHQVGMRRAWRESASAEMQGFNKACRL